MWWIVVRSSVDVDPVNLLQASPCNGLRLDRENNLPPPDIFTGTEEAFLSLSFIAFHRRWRLLAFNLFFFHGFVRNGSLGERFRGNFLFGFLCGGWFLACWFGFGWWFGSHLFRRRSLGHFGPSAWFARAALVGFEGALGKGALAPETDVETSVTCISKT